MTLTLRDLGWSPHFARQIEDGPSLDLYRVAAVDRDRIAALGPGGPVTLLPDRPVGEIAVGDWIAAEDGRMVRLFERETVLKRRAAGVEARVQLIAANVSTLFIVSSCNADFNEARLERYLVLAREAGSYPVIVLTKADLAEEARDYVRRAEALQPMLTVLAVDARQDAEAVMAWCGRGQTAALLGSSGVGKTTLMNAMTGGAEATQGVREDDAKGRHTTTRRSLRAMTNGGWLIDTPGMRALRLTDAEAGIDEVFGDIVELAGACRFADCAHEAEPGCAVQAAIAAGALEDGRLRRWRKLQSENRRNTETVAEARARDKSFGKMVREVMKEKTGRKGR
ncbi:ribosome small subunit-dependent GTPase A [Ovoidimarina sediminis]|uniref:ribosome small subunit-dependent GTPase A n=1 Tax=Ovoidimarina sediminis TaxID=3079856 RepID=UPI002911B446|nr:ribosome small subunit-dependent GTPase A [Rhodophyticola sp. MJ-SS7]MDU8944417.1 ribosome small subunit-dependent GTPase A [Rhodophyticola sp. MJ-SS7]